MQGSRWFTLLSLPALVSIGAVFLGLPYLTRAFGPTEAEVYLWGRVSCYTGIAMILLTAVTEIVKATSRKPVKGLVVVWGLGFLWLALLQMLPIYLWLAFHGYGISDGTPPSPFVAHWAYAIPHILELGFSILALYNLTRRRFVSAPRAEANLM